MPHQVRAQLDALGPGPEPGRPLEQKVAALRRAFGLGLLADPRPGGASFLLNALLWFLVGLEASSLRRWDYARRGRPERRAEAFPDCERRGSPLGWDA